MNAFEQIAERRIRDAIERGDLAQLQGHGARVPVERDNFVAPELRMAHRILANAGWVPEEVRVRRELAELRAQLAKSPPEDRCQVVRRLNLLLVKLETCRGGGRG